MRRPAADVLINAALLLAYFAAAKVGLSLAVVNQSATAVWPPTGIALAAVLLLGRRGWPALWGGAPLGHFTILHPPSPPAGVAPRKLFGTPRRAPLVSRLGQPPP